MFVVNLDSETVLTPIWGVKILEFQNRWFPFLSTRKTRMSSRSRRESESSLMPAKFWISPELHPKIATKYMEAIQPNKCPVFFSLLILENHNVFFSFLWNLTPKTKILLPKNILRSWKKNYIDVFLMKNPHHGSPLGWRFSSKGNLRISIDGRGQMVLPPKFRWVLDV